MSKFFSRLNAFLHKRRHNDPNAIMYLLNSEDDDCVDRIQITHHYVRSIFNGNYSVPIDTALQSSQCLNILDLGCGPGTFICDLSSDSRFSNANFVGVDYAKTIFPTQKPQNVQFMRANIFEGLPFRSGSFDVVFLRYLILANSVDQWEKIVTIELPRIVKSGGWIEILEPELIWNNQGPAMQRMTDAFYKLIQSRNMDPLIIHKIPQLIESTGQFKNVQRVVATTKFGRFGGKLGEVAQGLNIGVFAEASPRMLPILKMDNAQYDNLLRDVSRELTDGHVFQHQYRFFAQKI